MSAEATPRAVAPPSGRDERRATALAGLGALAVMLDSAVNIAFPAISGAFAVPVTRIQWVVVSYIAAFAATLLPAGRFGDRVGHPRVFRAGLALSGVAYLGCGLAPTFAALLAARVFQGVGAALLIGTAPALVTVATPAARRGRALGRYGFLQSLGGVLGPLAGGALVEALGWRIVYLARLPLVALAAGLAWPGRLDEAPRGRRPVGRGRRRVADLRTFLAANAAHGLANVAFFAVWLLVPYYLLERRGLSTGAGGALFATGPLAWAAATPLAGRLADSAARRWLAPLALVVQAGGLLLVSTLDERSVHVAIALALGLGGFGHGLFVVANTREVMAALPMARQGLAGSVVGLMRTVGIVVGASLTTLVYERRLAAHAASGEAAAGAAFADAFVVAAAIAAGGALLSLVPPRRAIEVSA